MQGSGHCAAAGASGYNDGTFRASMDVLEATGLLKLGYNLVLADDCVSEDQRPLLAPCEEALTRAAPPSPLPSHWTVGRSAHPRCSAPPHHHRIGQWIADNRSATGEIVADPSRFPHGMKPLADYAHNKGMLFGLYAAAGA